jgi:hypothetical protein
MKKIIAGRGGKSLRAFAAAQKNYLRFFIFPSKNN